MAQVAAVLGRYGYPVSERRLRDWVRKGLLPPLSQRGRGRGQGKVYYWPQRDIIRQARVIGELLAWRGRADVLPLMLWMLGYCVAVEDARTVLLHILQMRLEALTGGIATDDRDDQDNLEKLEDHLSALATMVGRGRSAAPKGSAQWPGVVREEAAELVLNVHANPHYAPSSVVVEDLRHALQRAGGDAGGDRTPDGEVDTATWMRVIAFVQAYMGSLHRRQEAVARATEAEMHQVQADMLALVGAARALLEPALGGHPSWAETKYNSLANIGVVVVPMLLSLRQDGHGHWVDLAAGILKALGTPRIVAALWQQDTATLAAAFAAFRPAIEELLGG